MRRRLVADRFRPLALCRVASVAASAALAEGSSKGHGEGGRFAVYYPIIAKYNKSGEVFRIEGACRSACTLFLSIRNVCIDRKAELSFHGGPDAKTHKVGPSSTSTRGILAAYKPALRKFLLDGHHVDLATYFTMTGATLIDQFGYTECSPPNRRCQTSGSDPRVGCFVAAHINLAAQLEEFSLLWLRACLIRPLLIKI